MTDQDIEITDLASSVEEAGLTRPGTVEIVTNSTDLVAVIAELHAALAPGDPGNFAGAPSTRTSMGPSSWNVCRP